jgi:hypothetical protein
MTMKETTRSRLEKYVLDSAAKKNGGVVYDERQRLQSSGALGAAVIFAMLFDVVMMAVHFFKHEGERAYPYLAQLLVMCAAFGIASLGSKEPHMPATLSGRSVDPAKTGKAFAKRFLACFIDSAVTAAVIFAFHVYDKNGVTAEIVRDAVFYFAGFLLIEVAVCERRVHRWRRFQSQLDAEENDLD